jgi:hypothetical protein
MLGGWSKIPCKDLDLSRGLNVFGEKVAHIFGNYSELDGELIGEIENVD